MIATALIIGFFSAIGWWGGNKTTEAIDHIIKRPVAECQANKEKQ